MTNRGSGEQQTTSDGDPADRDVPPTRLVRFQFTRNLLDWSDAEDGSDVRDYGWYVTLYVRGKHRVRWSSTRATTRMRPRICRGGDEDCNRATSLVLWPLGHLDVWWEPNWRPAGSGMCDRCKAELS